MIMTPGANWREEWSQRNYQNELTLDWIGLRHCERSEAIQGFAEELDCFVAIAPRIAIAPRNDDMSSTKNHRALVPRHAGRAHAQCEFGALRGLVDRIAGDRTGEAALRTNGETIAVDEVGGLIEALD